MAVSREGKEGRREGEEGREEGGRKGGEERGRGKEGEGKRGERGRKGGKGGREGEKGKGQRERGRGRGETEKSQGLSFRLRAGGELQRETKMTLFCWFQNLCLRNVTQGIRNQEEHSTGAFEAAEATSSVRGRGGQAAGGRWW